MSISHTLSPDRDQRLEAFAGAALVLAAFSTVMVFLPPEGVVMAPLHAAIQALLGRAAFLLPLALAFVGVLLLVRRVRPTFGLPSRRLAGLGLLAIAVIPGEQLFGDPTGLIGGWATELLLGVFGPPITATLLVVLVGLGAALTFDLNLRGQH